MYYSSNKEWAISNSNREYMEAGEAVGWLKATSTALTPDQTTETWQVSPSNGEGWLDVPKVRVRRL
jgi:hypothetical protein